MTTRAVFRLTCLSLLAFAGVAWAAPQVGASAYGAWLNDCLKALEKDIPTITASAEAAAKQYVHEDYRLAAAGEQYFTSEAQGRAGGLARLEVTKNITSTDPQMKYIVLFCPREAKLADDVAQIQKLQQLERMVIGFGRKSLLQQAIAAGAVFDATVETHAAEHGGLFQDEKGNWVVPTDPTASIAALWVWTAEFTAACMREGKMPPIYQSIMVPGAAERNAKLGTEKFHEQAPKPVRAGTLGRAYLRAVQENLAEVCKRELSNITVTADLAREAKTQGRHVYAYLLTHALVAQLPCPHDPGYFFQINRAWTMLKKEAVLEKDDVILCLSYDALLRGEKFGNFTENARTAGVKLIWSLADYKAEEVQAIQPGERWIKEYWALGDAVVEIPGYDIKAFPPSGVIEEAILWMINAEIFAKQHSALGK